MAATTAKKQRACIACGADLRYKKTWEKYDGDMTCMACGSAGITVRQARAARAAQ